MTFFGTSSTHFKSCEESFLIPALLHSLGQRAKARRPQEAVRKKNRGRTGKPLDDKCSVNELHFEECYILRECIRVIWTELQMLHACSGYNAVRRSHVVYVPMILPNSSKYIEHQGASQTGTLQTASICTAVE